MNSAFALVTSGPVFDICSAFDARRKAGDAAVAAVALELKATPGRSMRAGKWVEGLHFAPGSKPTGWRAAGKRFPGYFKPDTRTPIGKALAARLHAIELMVGEDLAAQLGLPPFFKDREGDWCTAAGLFAFGGACYLQIPVGFAHRFDKKDGIELIPEWQYMKAESDSRPSASPASHASHAQH